MSKGHIFKDGCEVLFTGIAGRIFHSSFTSGISLATVLSVGRGYKAQHIAVRAKNKQHWVVRECATGRKMFKQIDRIVVEMWLVMNN